MQNGFEEEGKNVNARLNQLVDTHLGFPTTDNFLLWRHILGYPDEINLALAKLRVKEMEACQVFLNFIQDGDCNKLEEWFNRHPDNIYVLAAQPYSFPEFFSDEEILRLTNALVQYFRAMLADMSAGVVGNEIVQ